MSPFFSSFFTYSLCSLFLRMCISSSCSATRLVLFRRMWTCSLCSASWECGPSHLVLFLDNADLILFRFLRIRTSSPCSLFLRMWTCSPCSASWECGPAHLVPLLQNVDVLTLFYFLRMRTCSPCSLFLKMRTCSPCSLFLRMRTCSPWSLFLTCSPCSASWECGPAHPILSSWPAHLVPLLENADGLDVEELAPGDASLAGRVHLGEASAGVLGLGAGQHLVLILLQGHVAVGQVVLQRQVVLCTWNTYI